MEIPFWRNEYLRSKREKAKDEHNEEANSQHSEIKPSKVEVGTFLPKRTYYWCPSKFIVASASTRNHLNSWGFI